MAENALPIVRPAWRGLWETWRRLAPLVLMTIVAAAVLNWTTQAASVVPSLPPGATPPPGVGALRHDLVHFVHQLRILGLLIALVCVEIPLDVAICRLLVLRDGDWRRAFLRPASFLRLLLYDLLLGAVFVGCLTVFIGLAAICGVFIVLTTHAASHKTIIFAAVSCGVLLGAVLGWYLMARLILVLPAIAVGERKATFRAAWRRSRGRVGTITIGYLSAIPLYVLLGILFIAQKEGAFGPHPTVTSGVGLLDLLLTSGLAICCRILFFSIVACLYRAGAGEPWSGSVQGGHPQGSAIL